MEGLLFLQFSNFFTSISKSQRNIHLEFVSHRKVKTAIKIMLTIKKMFLNRFTKSRLSLEMPRNFKARLCLPYQKYFKNGLKAVSSTKCCKTKS